MTVVLSVLLFLMTFSKFGSATDIVLIVNPTQVEAKRQETVVLDCQGNTRNLSQYISKRVNWKHVANDGTIHKITTGFYLDDGADKTKYDIQHGGSDNNDTNYSFRLKILSVNDDDDGKYVCEYIDNRLVIFSSKEVQFTVIKKVKIELLTVMTGPRMYSESQIMANSVIYEVEEGDFEVTCSAEGSNPTPQMALKFNNNVQQFYTKMEKYFVGNRPSYKGTFTKVLSLSSDTTDIQTIECSGGIPRKQFSDKYAGLKLKVFSDAVEKVKIELLTVMTGHRMYSESQIMANSVIYEVEEGDFEVTCTAEGSNPTSQMALKFNNNVQQVYTKMEKSFVGNRPSYKGTFTKVFSLSAYKTDIQTIECSGGIPRKQFSDKYAGLKLKVFSVVFNVECENVSALVNNRKTKLTCRLHGKGALNCNSISWVDGYNIYTIYPGNRIRDSIYGTVMALCNYVIHENKSMTVTTTLMIELVQDIHFHTVFFVQYNYGNHQYKSPPVKLYRKDVSAAVVVKPFGILLCTLLAFFVRRISRGL